MSLGVLTSSVLVSRDVDWFAFLAFSSLLQSQKKLFEVLLKNVKHYDKTMEKYVLQMALIAIVVENELW